MKVKDFRRNLLMSLSVLNEYDENMEIYGKPYICIRGGYKDPVRPDRECYYGGQFYENQKADVILVDLGDERFEDYED